MTKGQRGVYPLHLWSNRGLGYIPPRETPPRSPNSPKFGSYALARCLETLPSTRMFFIFIDIVIGANGIAAHKVS